MRSLAVLLFSWNIEGNADAAAATLADTAFQQQIFSQLNPASSPGNDPVDVFVLALQELPFGDSPTVYLTSDDAISRRCRGLVTAVTSSLPADFQHVQHAEYGFQSVDVFSRVRIQRTQVKPLGQGLAKVASNKGALGVRLLIAGRWLCIASVHLQPHQGDANRRRRLAQLEELIAEFCNGHDHVLSLGDFNFRLGDMSFSMAMAAIASGDIASLLAFDDLPQHLGFSEADIAFPPTYKLLPQTPVRQQYNRKRTPAYCDRVLYAGVGGRCTLYGSVQQQNCSDHRPVYAIYRLDWEAPPPPTAAAFKHWPRPRVASAVVFSWSRLPFLWKVGFGASVASFLLWMYSRMVVSIT